VNFAAPWFLLGAVLALVYGAVLLLGAARARRARAAFGDEARLAALATSDPSKRRAYKGVALVLATGLAFVAAARPQYGRETQLVPATKVDLVVVLDLSKSMYARDVAPSRIFRAKAEIAELVQALPGVRFGAVAFAGDAMTFPLTADGAAIAQFFRGIEPNDMPLGGTAIGTALHQARELYKRDPKSADHKRFVVLITDGEDLEGTALTSAKRLAADKTTLHVVQIGGRTPERIPEIGPTGEMLGWRKAADGSFLTTELSAGGEAQLESLAKATPGGKIVRAERGRTGIEEITAELEAAMKGGEFSERYEEVYADVYEWPLGLAVLLLLLEVLVADGPLPRFERKPPPAPNERRGLGRAFGRKGGARV
jgi:Ca-activated chloride channel family protein